MNRLFNTRTQEISRLENVLKTERRSLYYFPDMGINILDILRSDINFPKEFVDSYIYQHLSEYSSKLASLSSDITDFNYSVTIQYDNKTNEVIKWQI